MEIALYEQIKLTNALHALNIPGLANAGPSDGGGCEYDFRHSQLASVDAS